MIKIKKNAFTLPEVLITLAVVGALAALVIPGLIKDANSRAMTALLQSTIANLNDAVANELVRSRASNIKDTLIYSDPAEFLADNFDVEMTCDSSQGTLCFASSYKNLNGDTISVTVNNPVLLKNGAAININENNYDGSNLSGQEVLIDLNGSKEPNIFGIDMFSVIIFLSTATKSTLWHMGDVGSYSGEDEKTLKSYCKKATDVGDTFNCYALLERSGFDPNYLDKEYNE